MRESNACKHEHAGLCRHQPGAGEQRKLHREHGAADGDQFRRRFGVAGDCLLRPRSPYYPAPGNSFMASTGRFLYFRRNDPLVSTIVFGELRRGDGDVVSRRTELHGE